MQQKAMFAKIKYSKTWQVLYKPKGMPFFERTKEFKTQKEAEKVAQLLKKPTVEVEVIDIEREK